MHRLRAAKSSASDSPSQIGASGLAAWVLAATMVLAPALGVPHLEMLQDTFKSILISFGVLAAALVFFVHPRSRPETLRWHPILWLPLMLLGHALGSMVWSHTYLAGVEAVRWFIFSLLLWLGLNNFSRAHFVLLAWALHLGAVIASVWAGLQFWFDLRLFPQGPHPGSTFVNRNFFAEFAVCTLPFAAMLLAQARTRARIVLLSLSGGFVIVAILMTGTRSAQIALWLQLLIVFPLIAWRCRAQLAFFSWPRRTRMLAAGLLAGTVVGMGLIPSADGTLLAEGGGATALQRTLTRAQSIRQDDLSLGFRVAMWRATRNMIEARPFSGVGAGAWENEVSRYQEDGAQVERDFYAHNEFLQLIGEYGLVGWASLLALLAYLWQAARRTWRASTAAEQAEAPGRAFLLASVFALLVVSASGFPWRLAVTGALFALCLASLAASDYRLGYSGRTVAAWKRPWFAIAAIATSACMALATFVSYRATQSESRIVRAEQMALAISASGRDNDPAWGPAKQEMLRLAREGVALNPHYRKITPTIADQLARWGDWPDAIWIWDSVLSSRPYVVAIISNVARGHLALGRTDKAVAYLERARSIQPHAPAVRALDALLAAQAGQDARALKLAKDAMAAHAYDFDLPYTAFVLGWRTGDYAFAREAVQTRIAQSPEKQGESYVLLGNLYAQALHDASTAMAHYRSALAVAPASQRTRLLERIPRQFWPQLNEPATPARSPQTSASSG